MKKILTACFVWCALLGAAQVAFVPQAHAAITSALVDSTERDGTVGTTSTITGVTFGTAFSGRVICVFGGTENNNVPTSATIAGITAVITAVSVTGAWILSAVVPTGTSGTVVLHYSTSDQAIFAGAVALTGASSATPSATLKTGNAGSISVAAGGCIVGFSIATATGIWTGLTGLFTNTNFFGVGLIATGAKLDSATAQSVSIGYSTSFTQLAVAFTAGGGPPPSLAPQLPLLGAGH